jgi:hypothetical protein
MHDIQQIVVSFQNPQGRLIEYTVAYAPPLLATTVLYSLLGPCKAYMLQSGYPQGSMSIRAYDYATQGYTTVMYKIGL